MIYLQTILKRSESEVTKKVYLKQKENPVPGDWTNLVRNDFKIIGCNLTDTDIEDMSVDTYKNFIKNKVREKAFEDLQEIRKSHSKVSDLIYKNFLQPQEYLTNSTFSYSEVCVLFGLRSKTMRGIKGNFSYLQNGGDSLCPVCQKHNDTQAEVMECKILRSMVVFSDSVKYSQIFGNVQEQKEVVNVYIRLLSARDQLLADQPEVQQCLPGHQYWAQAPQGGH